MADEERFQRIDSTLSRTKELQRRSRSLLEGEIAHYSRGRGMNSGRSMMIILDDLTEEQKQELAAIEERLLTMADSAEENHRTVLKERPDDRREG
jgi:hypothetical protein